LAILFLLISVGGGDGDSALRGCEKGKSIAPAGLCGIGILPMPHGLEGDPKRDRSRWGTQAHATGTRFSRTLGEKEMAMAFGRVFGDLGCLIGKGLLAGLVGTAAITVSQVMEMELSGREPSTTPAEAVEKVLGIKAIDDDHKAKLAQLVHWGYGTSWGLFRSALEVLGLQGFGASVIHWLAIWGAALVMLPGLEVAPPAREWPVKMHVTGGVGHLIYAEAAGLIYDLMSEE
jgi:hypothetical protein